MSTRKSDNFQSIILAIAAVIVVLAAVIFFNDFRPPVRRAEPSASRPASVPDEPPPQSPPRIVEDAPASTPAPPARLAPSAEPPTPIAVLEAQFRAARATDDRIDLVGQIADWNDANAVEALRRLFQIEHHPGIKLALITDLHDINADAAPAARLDLLQSAVRNQPRAVRAAALDSLAQIEDPRVAPILKQAMVNDPDREVRDQAAALYQILREEKR